MADLGDILKKHLRWLKALPRVTPFYAVKCNDSRTIVKTLAAIGTGFDCASKVSKTQQDSEVAGQISAVFFGQEMLRREGSCDVTTSHVFLFLSILAPYV